MRENHEKEAANWTYRSRCSKVVTSPPRKDKVSSPAVVDELHDERPVEVEGDCREPVFQG
jgi:hypothetical protein